MKNQSMTLKERELAVQARVEELEYWKELISENLVKVNELLAKIAPIQALLGEDSEYRITLISGADGEKRAPGIKLNFSDMLTSSKNLINSGIKLAPRESIALILYVVALDLKTNQRIRVRDISAKMEEFAPDVQKPSNFVYHANQLSGFHLCERSDDNNGRSGDYDIILDKKELRKLVVPILGKYNGSIDLSAAGRS